MTQWIRNSTRARIYARDTPPGQKSPACTYCGRAVSVGRTPSDSEAGLAAAVLDHVDPDGGNGMRNLVTACWSCNAEKGTRTPDQWEWDRLSSGYDSGAPPWRSRRPEPDLTLAERAYEAVNRPVCRATAAACELKIREIEERRRRNAEFQRRRKGYA